MSRASKEEMEELCALKNFLEAKVKGINRENKIKSILDDSEYIELDIKDLPEYKKYEDWLYDIIGQPGTQGVQGIIDVAYHVPQGISYI